MIDQPSESNLTGAHWIAGQSVAAEQPDYRAAAAATGQPLPPLYGDATPAQIDMACEAAEQAFQVYRRHSRETRACLLEALADELMTVGDRLLDRCDAETALGRERLLFERRRTVNQARLFAQVVREGSWSEPRIDHAESSLQTPDCRSLWLPVGPVAVFGASNFPLAISVVGNDTIAALAAGCPVVVKAHPGHPGTCEILAGCLNSAIRKCGLPPGLFSLLHGAGHAVGQRLVQDPRIQAVGFTGSLSGGRALFDAVCRRPQLIPVYAEMGSVNPVFFFPAALRDARWQHLVAPLVGSLTAGCGQMCTQPGLLLGTVNDDWEKLRDQVALRIAAAADYTLLHPGIARAFRVLVGERSTQPALRVLGSPSWAATSSPVDRMPADTDSADADSADRRPADEVAEPADGCRVSGLAFSTNVATLLANPNLEEEIFGPTTLFVDCDSVAGMIRYARQMKGSLTASVFATEQEYDAVAPLLEILQAKVGRIVFNGFPTGVQVNHAMMHGGPYPAAIGSFTSIGTGSIKRFARPVCFQQFPDSLLPESLRDAFTGPALRMVDGRYEIGTNHS